MVQLKFNFLVKVLWPDIVITVSWCEQRAEGSEAVFKVELFKKFTITLSLQRETLQPAVHKRELLLRKRDRPTDGQCVSMYTMYWMSKC